MMGGGGNSSFAFKMLIFAIVIMVAMPLMINNFVPQNAENTTQEQLLKDYYNFTGQGVTDESVWVLSGIYTPYQGGNYGYTDDGWIYGSRVSYYAPSQYQGTDFAYDVMRDDRNGIYVYASNSEDYSEPVTQTTQSGETITISEATGHKKGDLYTSVSFDKDKKSDIFFSPSLKYGQSGEKYVNGSNEPFYYDFSGYRYSFQPTSNAYIVDADGNKVPLIATTTSLSLIWYSYYTADGISGQLVISGNDSGVSYLTSDQIVSAFNSTTSTARFEMTFNGGVQMGIYVKIDPWYLANTNYTVKDCYEMGYWSIMVTSISTHADSYTGTDFSMNLAQLFQTVVKLMTFNYQDFGMSDMMGYICSFVIIIPLYAGLIALALDSLPALILTAIVGFVEMIATAMSKLGGWWPF